MQGHRWASITFLFILLIEGLLQQDIFGGNILGLFFTLNACRIWHHIMVCYYIWSHETCLCKFFLWVVYWALANNTAMCRLKLIAHCQNVWMSGVLFQVLPDHKPYISSTNTTKKSDIILVNMKHRCVFGVLHYLRGSISLHATTFYHYMIMVIIPLVEIVGWSCCLWMFFI